MKKVLRTILAIIIVGLVVCAWLFIHKQNKIKENSTYCMDKVRQELWEYLENIQMTDVIISEWVYGYMWSVSYEWVDYSYSCKVYNKENVELDLVPLYPEEIAEEEAAVEETEINETEEVSDDEDMPVAKMRVLEWQTEEETQAMVEEACSNVWWTWTDGSCMLEDGSYINF